MILSTSSRSSTANRRKVQSPAREEWYQLLPLRSPSSCPWVSSLDYSAHYLLVPGRWHLWLSVVAWVPQSWAIVWHRPPISAFWGRVSAGVHLALCSIPRPDPSRPPCHNCQPRNCASRMTPDNAHEVLFWFHGLVCWVFVALPFHLKQDGTLSRR